MQLDRVRRMALAVTVLSAVWAISASAGASPAATPGSSVASGSSLVAGSDDTIGPSGSSGPTGVSGATGSTSPPVQTPDGPSGASGTTGSTGSPASTSGSATTGTTGPSSAASTPTSPDTAPTVTTPAAPQESSGPSTPGSSTSVADPATGSGSASTSKSVAPVVTGVQAQPQSGTSEGTGATKHSPSNGGSTVSSGPTAPSPALFEGSNPLSGVLPGSWDDPFIVNGKAEVPAFYVESFHIPPFLLPIYQAAGAAYGIPWQTLAAINEVETNYGTDLDTSSAGAIGWMQFLPRTWRRYGIDASASGARDPYNAADAIFAAARYLAAAGGTHNLPAAIFAYNHSHSYVRSVLLRAELLSGEPSALINGVTELAEGDFPIQLRYHASYKPASESSPTPSASAAITSAAKGAAPSPSAVGQAVAGSAPVAEDIYAASDAAVVAAQDGTIVAIGHNRQLGRFVVLRNAFGDRFTYGHLGSVSPWFPKAKSPHPSAALLSTAAPAVLAPGPRPTAPATAGAQSGSGRSALSGSLFRRTTQANTTADVPSSPVVVTLNLRSSPSSSTLFTPIPVLEHATRVTVTHARHERLATYFTGAFGLRPNQLVLARLAVGSHVMAGTILGRLRHTTKGHKAHLIFELRPAGPGQRSIDPRPFLDAWSQLETLELHRNSFDDPVYGPNLHATSAGTVLWASQLDIERIVLEDQHVTLAPCERTAIESGNVDRRVLASLEILVIHGIDPTVSGAWCGSHKQASPAILKTGDAVALSALDGRPIAGVSEVAIKALGKLPRASRPALSLHTASGQLVLSFAPAHEPQALAAAASFTSGFALSSSRWTQLEQRLSQIAEPRVPTAVSAVALPDPTKHTTAHTAATR